MHKYKLDNCKSFIKSSKISFYQRRISSKLFPPIPILKDHQKEQKTKLKNLIKNGIVIGEENARFSFNYYFLSIMRLIN